MTKTALLRTAKNILSENWRNTNTVPSPKLYPHQWNWDSGFIAIGYAHYNQKRAAQELQSLFAGQWKNGMLPSIIFRSKGAYFPGPDYWQSELSQDAPKLPTSGITQPPIHAIAALKMYQHAKNKKTLQELYPKILAFHRYLHTARDPERSGFATIFHPWESGLDNSPRWDEVMTRIKPRNLPKYKRVDNKRIDATERPSDETYDKFVYLMEIMKKGKYEPATFYKKIPFRVKDLLFNSILYTANQALSTISEIIQEDDSEMKAWLKRMKKNYAKKFKDPSHHLFFDYDLVKKKLLKKRTIASLMPLYTDLLTKQQNDKLITWMKHSYLCWEHCKHSHKVIASTSFEEEAFNPLNYWRGPIWINMNWLLYSGLRKHQHIKEAKKLKTAILELVEEHGFNEYYNPLSGEGLGSKNFSWTAALVIDLLED